MSSTKLAAPPSGLDASSGRKVKGDGTPSSDRSQKSSRRESPQRRKQPAKDGSCKKNKADPASSSADAAIAPPSPPSALQSSLPPPPQHNQGGTPSGTPPPSSRHGGGKSKKLSARFASADGPERERVAHTRRIAEMQAGTHDVYVHSPQGKNASAYTWKMQARTHACASTYTWEAACRQRSPVLSQDRLVPARQDLLQFVCV